MDQELSRPISYCFWKGFLKDSMRNWQKLCRPLAYRCWKECLKDFRWQVTRSSATFIWCSIVQWKLQFSLCFSLIFNGNAIQHPQNKFPVDFWKTFLKDSTNRLTESTPDQFPIDLKGFPEGFQKYCQEPSWQISDCFWKGCFKDSTAKLPRSSPDQFAFDFGQIFKGLLVGVDQEPSRPIANWFWMNSLRSP